MLADLKILTISLMIGTATIAAPAQPIAPAARPLPKSPAQVAELVHQYEQAAGVAALKAIKTRSCQGSVERQPSGLTVGQAVTPFEGKVELDWMAPGKAREVWSNAAARIRRISDGEHGWEVGTGETRRELTQAERVEVSRLGALYQPALVLPLDELAFMRRDKVGERSAIVLQTHGGELLWLDEETHLPLREDLLVEHGEASRRGEFYLSQVFFDSWAPVGTSAVQLPLVIRRVLAQATLTYKLDNVQHDLELSTGLFKIPYFWRK